MRHYWLSDDQWIANVEQRMVDGSLVRAHQYGTTKNAVKLDAIDALRGGRNTKGHAAVNARGNRVRLLLTPLQAAAYGQTEASLEGFKPDHLPAGIVKPSRVLGGRR